MITIVIITMALQVNFQNNFLPFYFFFSPTILINTALQYKRKRNGDHFKKIFALMYFAYVKIISKDAVLQCKQLKYKIFTLFWNKRPQRQILFQNQWFAIFSSWVLTTVIHSFLNKDMYFHGKMGIYSLPFSVMKFWFFFPKFICLKTLLLPFYVIME